MLWCAVPGCLIRGGPTFAWRGCDCTERNAPFFTLRFVFSMRLLLLPLYLLLALPLAAAPDVSRNGKIQTMIQNPVPATRAAAYKQMRDLGDAGKSDYQTVLEAALRQCTAELTKAARSAAGNKVLTAATAWRTERDSLYKFVMTDHHKEKSKISEMSRRYDALEKQHARMIRNLEPAMAALQAAADRWTVPMIEIRAELDWALGKSEAEKHSAGDMLKEADATSLLDGMTMLKGIVDSWKEFQAVEKRAASQQWATAPQKTFSTILNQRRAVLLLPLVKIDENLSAACRQHSEEMIALKYFAHESPVPENKTPWDRAKNAKFAGDASGECIFMGSGAAQSAHGGWWGSDGHRLIMYAEKINTLGIAMAGGSHWTLMTGNRNWAAED